MFSDGAARVLLRLLVTLAVIRHGPNTSLRTAAVTEVVVCGLTTAVLSARRLKSRAVTVRAGEGAVESGARVPLLGDAEVKQGIVRSLQSHRGSAAPCRASLRVSGDLDDQLHPCTGVKHPH